MVQKYGCSTPFGSNKTNMCKKIDTTKYFEIYSKVQLNGSNPTPCKFLGNFYLSEKKATLPGLHIFAFSSFVQKYESKYSYQWLDLFADLGGYLGIFLGTSLFQLKDGFAYLIKKLYK